jgi:hypothetical protein
MGLGFSKHIYVRFEILINSNWEFEQNSTAEQCFWKRGASQRTHTKYSQLRNEMWNRKDRSIVCHFYVSKPNKHTQHSEHSESNTWYYLLLCKWSTHNVLKV